MNKRIIVVTLIFSLVIATLFTPSSAVIPDDFWKSIPADATFTSELPTTSHKQTLMKAFSKMSVVELNSYISNGLCSLKDTGNNVSTRDVSLEDLWLAAAAAAAVAGYPLAATLVSYSVFGIDYYEYNGDFSTAIKSSSEYRTWINRYPRPTTIEFASGDLFYALHYANINVASSSSKGAVINVLDTFDFDANAEFQSVFANLVNDWAALCQYIHVLKVIDIEICFTA